LGVQVVLILGWLNFRSTLSPSLEHGGVRCSAHSPVVMVLHEEGSLH
jgi:hypothetical protein